jgi:hypothetical protein
MTVLNSVLRSFSASPGGSAATASNITVSAETLYWASVLAVLPVHHRASPLDVSPCADCTYGGGNLQMVTPLSIQHRRKAFTEQFHKRLLSPGGSAQVSAIVGFLLQPPH